MIVDDRRGDGKLYVTFVDIGHGDCTMICCPNGKLVLIDCGSKEWGPKDQEDIDAKKERVKQTLADNQLYLYDNYGYGDQSLVIEALVLTHPDNDHFNRIIPFFWGYEKLRLTRFGTVYHSRSLSEYSDRHGVISDWIRQAIVGPVRQVVPQGAPPPARLPPFPPGTTAPANTLYVPGNDTYQIVDGTQKKTDGSNQDLPGADRCTVDILIGGYVADGDNPSHLKNSASIVVKVTFGDDKLIIAGDATTETEEALRTKYSNTTWLQANTLRIAHHGSDTSTSRPFLEHVFTGMNSPLAVVSTIFPSHDFPRKTVIDECKRFIPEPSDPDGNIQTHQIGWTHPFKVEETKREIYLTGLGGSVGRIFSGR